MIKIILSIILALGIYPSAGQVIDTDTQQDLVIVETQDGNLWAFESEDEWVIGDHVGLVFWDKGTQEIYDDEIVVARYLGFSV